MIEQILSRLEKVSSMGAGRWKACCPAHDDKTPSFVIRQVEDGRLLMHCFSGCSVNEVCESLDINLSDLMPPSDHYKPAHYYQRANTPTEDSFFIEICKAAVRCGETLSADVKEKYKKAVLRESRI